MRTHCSCYAGVVSLYKQNAHNSKSSVLLRTEPNCAHKSTNGKHNTWSNITQKSINEIIRNNFSRTTQQTSTKLFPTASQNTCTTEEVPRAFKPPHVPKRPSRPLDRFPLLLEPFGRFYFCSVVPPGVFIFGVPLPIFLPPPPP